MLGTVLDARLKPFEAELKEVKDSNAKSFADQDSKIREMDRENRLMMYGDEIIAHQSKETWVSRRGSP